MFTGKTKRILKQVGLWSITIPMVGMFLMGGTAKIMGADPFPANYEAWGFPLWFLYVVGTIEVLGAIALLIPRLASLGALALGGAMAGAVTTHVIAGEWAATLLPTMLFGLLVIVGYARRHFVLERFGFGQPVRERA